MRVLHFYKTARPETQGGVEQVIHQIALGTRAAGITTDVLALAASGPRGADDTDGYRSHRARLNFEIASTGFSLDAFRRFAALARTADIVHYHFPWPFMDLVHFAIRPRCPTVVTYHSDIVRQRHLLSLYRPLKRRFLASVDRIVATSPEYLASSPVLQACAAKVEVIPIGLDQATYPQPAPHRLAEWRARLGEKFFLFVGACRYYKGLHLLIDVAQATGYPVVIVGGGALEAGLRAQAARSGATGVHFLGILPDEDKVALLQLAYALVLPSHLRAEAFGIALLEGAMYGKPLISTALGTGTSFINRAGETGLVVPPGDAAALAHAMRTLWEAPATAAAMGARAAERYQQHFTAAAMARDYAALYRRLAG